MQAFSWLVSLVAITFALSIAPSEARLSASKRSHHPHKPVIRSLPRDFIASSIEERDVEQEGVFHLDFIKRSGAARDTSLVRRKEQDIETRISDFAVKVAINGKDYKMEFQTMSDIVMTESVQDDPQAWNPAKDKHASPNGPPAISVFQKKGDQYKVSQFSIGQTTLSDFGLIATPPIGKAPPGDPVGVIGFGLQGSGIYPKSNASPFLSTIAKNKAWDQNIFSLAMGGRLNKTDRLILGAAAPSTKGVKPFWSASGSKSWTLPISIAGHKGIADVATNTDFIIAPPDVAKDLITKVGLTPTKDDNGDIVGKLDCSKNIGDTQIDLEGGSLLFGSEAGAIVDASGSDCIYIVKGVDQGKYPTPYSLGKAVLYNFNAAFDFTPGSPKIGFAPLVS